MHDVLSGSEHRYSISEIEKAFAECEFWVGAQIQKENQTGIRMDDETFLNHMIAIYQECLQLSQEECSSIRPVLGRRYQRSDQLNQGVMQTLHQLSAAGIRLGIVSNNDSSVRESLQLFGLTHFFDCIILSEEVGIYKPDPAIIHLACRKCGVSCQETLYVGDHPFDISCAHLAGAAAAWMPPNQWYRLAEDCRPPEYRLHQLTDLITLMEL